MTIIPASQARASLPEILDRVLAGEEVTITRHGRPVAVVVRPDTLRARRADRAVADAERLHGVFTRARLSHLDDLPALPVDRVGDLIRDVDAGRADR